MPGPRTRRPLPEGGNVGCPHLRCPCKTKFAEVTDEAIIYGCRGCGELILPFDVLRRGKEAVIAYLGGLPPRKKRFGRRGERPQK